MHNLIRHLEDEVDTILWPHHTQIGGHVWFGPPDARLGRRATKRGQVRPGADDGHARRGQIVPLEHYPRYESLVAMTWSAVLDVDRSMNTALCTPSGSRRESEREELGTQIVVIENEGRPMRTRKRTPMGQKMSGGLHV